MVNVEVYCPPCDNFHQCPHKGKFIGVVKEERLYTNPPPYVRCPTVGRKIYLNHPSRYKILKTERHEAQDTKIEHETMAYTTKRSKWSRKARQERLRNIREERKRK